LSILFSPGPCGGSESSKHKSGSGVDRLIEIEITADFSIQTINFQPH